MTGCLAPPRVGPARRCRVGEAAQAPGGWQRAEWNGVSAALRKAGGIEAAPSITLRAPSPGGETARIAARRHELAESLKLRVAGGQLTTVLSPMGSEITSVDLSGPHPVVGLDGGERIETPLLIGADGLHSKARKALNGDAVPPGTW